MYVRNASGRINYVPPFMEEDVVKQDVVVLSISEELAFLGREEKEIGVGGLRDTRIKIKRELKGLPTDEEIINTDFAKVLEDQKKKDAEAMKPKVKRAKK